MEASKFIKESIRMCGNYHCDDCPAGGFNSPCIADSTSLADDDVALEKYLAIVEKWSKEHPIITNEDKFKQVFGENALRYIKGIAGLSYNPAIGERITSFLNAEYEEEKINGST